MAHDMDLAPSQHWFCAAIVTIHFTLSMCSTFFILSMTFERVYSIIKPHKAASFNTARRAKITILCIISFSIIYNFPGWFVTGQAGESRNCVPYGNAMNSIQGQVYYWTSNVLNFILPFVLLLIMNTVIIHALRNRATLTMAARTVSQGQSQMRQKRSSETQITVMLLLVTFSYLLLVSPAYLYVYLVLTNVNKETPYHQALFHLIFSVAQKALYTNNGINFFLYVLSGQKFRNDLILLLKRILSCRKLAGNQFASDMSETNTVSVVC